MKIVKFLLFVSALLLVVYVIVWLVISNRKTEEKRRLEKAEVGYILKDMIKKWNAGFGAYYSDPRLDAFSDSIYEAFTAKMPEMLFEVGKNPIFFIAFLWDIEKISEKEYRLYFYDYPSLLTYKLIVKVNLEQFEYVISKNKNFIAKGCPTNKYALVINVSAIIPRELDNPEEGRDPKNAFVGECLEILYLKGDY